MKKILTLVVILVCGLKTNAQSYDDYLQIAYKHLKDGKIENAQKAYKIFREMSSKIDKDFELRLQELETHNLWLKSCYIINLGDGSAIAVQKPDYVLLSQEEASARCQGSRLGGFTDWRLPTKIELEIIFANIKLLRQGRYDSDFFWTSTKRYTDKEYKKEYSREEYKAHGNIIFFVGAPTGAMTIKSGYHYRYYYLVVRKYKL